MMDHKRNSMFLIALSMLAAVVAGVDFFMRISILDLAGTQWILIAILLGIYGLYCQSRGEKSE
jgi:hypothetical protein